MPVRHAFRRQKGKPNMREFVITDASMPRLDSALLAQYPQLSPGRLHKYLRENKIKVDGKKLPLSARLPRGSTVRVFLPDLLLDKPDGPLFLSARPELCAVYEDSDVLVADKPAGLPVTDEGGRTADTLINRALLYLYHKGEYAPERGWTPSLCHRLDTGTSGLVLIAKTQQAEALLLHLVKERMIEKKYLCVTYGHPSPAAATLRGYLQKDARQARVRILDTPAPGAKDIVTKYKTLAVSGRLALLEVELVTGRTHQIRALVLHRLPYPWRRQIREQRGQPGTEAQISGSVRVQPSLSRVAGRIVRGALRQNAVCFPALVLCAGPGRNA